MLDFIKNLFKNKITFPTGALDGFVDTRTVQVAQFQAPVAIPSDLDHELAEPRNQGSKPKCCGSANRKIVEWKFKQKGIVVDLSDDDLYEQCKLIDGIPDQDGTWPIMAAKVIKNIGVASSAVYATGNQTKIAEDRKKYKLSGYAQVANDYNAICQALFQNGPVSAAFYIDYNWFTGIIMRILKSIGRHDVVLNGYNIPLGLLRGQNSWGNGWIGYIAGKFDKNVKPGHFQALWADVSDTIGDIFAFTDIPEELLNDTKKKTYNFTQTLRLGSTGPEVMELQKMLGIVADGKFGSGTERAVVSWQISNGLKPDGVFGRDSRLIANKESKSRLAVWAMAIQNHEGYYLPGSKYPTGSKSYRNKNPGNFRWTQFVQDTLGAVGKDSSGFAIFKTYEAGFAGLMAFLKMAATDRLKYYKSTMTLAEFFAVYAPAFENDTKAYAKNAAKEIGVATTIQIRDLV